MSYPGQSLEEPYSGVFWSPSRIGHQNKIRELEEFAYSDKHNMTKKKSNYDWELS